ncbi:hypothetical protein S83_066359, partial [Arachis hypogaea]
EMTGGVSIELGVGCIAGVSGESTIELHYLPVYEETYKSLKSRGIQFPGRHNESLAPIFSSFTPEQTKEAFDVARNNIELLSTVLSSPQQDVLQVWISPISIW